MEKVLSGKKILNIGRKRLKKWTDKKEKLTAQLRLADLELYKAKVLIDAYESFETNATNQITIPQ